MAFTKKVKEELFKEPFDVVGVAKTELGLVSITIQVNQYGEVVPNSLNIFGPNLKAIIFEKTKANLGRALLKC